MIRLTGKFMQTGCLGKKVMKTGKPLILVLAALLWVGMTTAGLAAERDTIDITNPFLKKIPLAVPMVKTVTGAEVEREVSEDVVDLIGKTLEFTGYFRLISKDVYLDDLRNSGIVGPNIRFGNWTTIGAELLITGGLSVKDDVVVMELRLFDTFKQRMLIGKKYSGRVCDRRRMIHRFCGEIIYMLTGSKGFFNSRIAFVSNGTGNKEIYICEFDGFDPKQITRNRSINLSPAWSSDGKCLAYTSYAKGRPDLYIKHLSENRGAVVSRKGVNITPAWVPGKFELAATLSFSGDQEIYMLTGTGKMIKRLTDSWGIDVSPTWSPDGKKMAFVSDRSGTPQIYIKHLAEGRTERLTFQGRYNTTPSWSPVDDRIAFSASAQGEINIFVIRETGDGLSRLTWQSGRNESPTWSPDGSMIAFSSTRDGKAGIYVMTAYGTDQRRLIELPGEQTHPRWSPIILND